jgi:predicted RNase H-like HicB family nuclease
MKSYTAVVEKDPQTGLYVGYVPGVPGAHSQGATLEELRDNLKEVLELLEEDGMLEPESEFVGTQQILVA